MLVIATLWSFSASAQSAPLDAEALIRNGVELRKQGKNAEALGEFEKAYQAQPSARARAQVALARQALGQWRVAEQGLLAALAEPNDPWIARYQEPLHAALETVRDHLGTLQIDSSVAGATILIDDQNVGRSPLPAPVRIAAGIARVEVRADGYPPVKREIEVPPRGSVQASIVMVAAPQAPATDPGSAAGPATPQPAAASLPLEPRTEIAEHQPSSTSGLHRAGWVALIAVGPLLATGVVSHVVREHNAGVYNDDERCFHGDQTRDQRCGAYRDRAELGNVLAIVGYAAGGAALAVGAGLLLATPGADQREQAQLELMPSVGKGSATFTGRLRF